MLKPGYLWTILILNLILVTIDVIGAFRLDAFLDEDYEWIFISTMVSTLFLVQAIYVYILGKFQMTDYTLRTRVTLEGVEIVGVSVNEEELFKFKIDPEKLQSQGLIPGMYRNYYLVG